MEARYYLRSHVCGGGPVTSASRDGSLVNSVGLAPDERRAAARLAAAPALASHAPHSLQIDKQLYRKSPQTHE